MNMVDKQETYKKRQQRFNKALSRKQLWLSELSDAYKYAYPVRNSFYKSEDAEDQSKHVFDHTAINALEEFASALVSTLMPRGQRWGEIQLTQRVKNTLSSDDIQEAERQLQNIMTTVFEVVEKSNFYMSVAASFKEMGISTGAILFNEMNDDNVPFSVTSVPLTDIYVDTNSRDEIAGIWRKWSLTKEQILENWDITNIEGLNAGDTDEVEVVEGTIYYFQNDDENKYFYYVSIPSLQKDIYSKFFSYNPFKVFRWSVSPGEALGRGVVLNVLSEIKTANAIKEMELAGASMSINPPLMVEDDGVIDVYNVRLDPGALIPIGTSGASKDPVRQVALESNPKFAQQQLLEIQQNIKEAMLANPLPPMSQEHDKTATEISLRNEQWSRRVSSAYSRIGAELVVPTLQTILTILRKHNIISDIKVGTKRLNVANFHNNIDVVYKSPLQDIQKQEDVRKLNDYLTLINAQFQQPQSMAAIKVPELPQYLADKFNIDLDMIPKPQEVKQGISQLQKEMAQAEQGKQQEQQPAEPQAPLTGNLANVLG